MVMCRFCGRNFAQGLGSPGVSRRTTCDDCSRSRRFTSKPPPEKRVGSLRGKTQSGSIVEQLEILARLYQDGALTEQEFKTLKSRLINGE